MKFTIDIKDFWLDQEDDLKPALKKYIVDTTVKTIYEKLNTKVTRELETAIEAGIKSCIDELVDERMGDFVSKVITNREVKSNAYLNSGEMITLEEHITNQIVGRNTPHSIEEAIKIVGNKFGEKIKERYDSIFASKIISQLENSGLLKDGVAKILLNGENGK